MVDGSINAMGPIAALTWTAIGGMAEEYNKKIEMLQRAWEQKE